MIVAAEPRRANTRHRASPRARRLLREYDLRERDVTGSGPEGRIRRADVESAVSAGARPEPEYWRENRPADAATADSPANTRLAPALVAVEVDFFRIDRVRREGTDAPAGELAYVARAVVDALAAYPYLNAQVGDQTVVEHRPVHLGITVDLDPDGMTVPVLRDAESLRLRSLADRLATTIADARATSRGRRPSDERTFTIGSPAPYGPLLSTPPLAPRQVAALGIGAVTPKPVAVEREPGEYGVAVHPVGLLALSFDAGVIDTGYAARFLDHVRHCLETRDWAGEL